MTFPDLSIKSEYRSLKDDVVKDFYIPTLSAAVSYKRSVGFFSSTALELFSKGLCELAKNGGQIELVASPYLSAEDEEAIRKGYENREKIIENALLRNLQNAEEIKNPFTKERLNLLANLIESGVLNIKIAFTENESSSTVGMYHEKLGIIEDKNGNRIAFSGSMNESGTALTKNYEAIDIFCSWKNGDENSRVVQKLEAFSRIWGNYEPGLKVKQFPLVDKAILEKYKRGKSDFDLDKKEFEKNDTVVAQNRNFSIFNKNDVSTNSKNVDIEYKIKHPEIEELKVAESIPTFSTTFFDFHGEIFPRSHQIKAIENFKINSFQSLFAMATGTGKTLTSLFAANELSKEIDLLSILIIVPLKDLVDQWQKDVEKYFSGEIIPIRSGLDWNEKLSELNILRILKNNSNRKISVASTKMTTHKNSEKIVIITTYDSFCQNSEKILSSLEAEKTLIIADEVHKFGAETYSQKLPEKIKYRIGLSATPKRPYDEKGTAAIFDYFCPSQNPYEFTILNAIQADMLCHYEYHPTIVTLTDFEMEDYENISEKISKLSAIINNSKTSSKEDKKNLEQLLKERHRIIERAENKKDLFLEIMLHEIEKYPNKTIVFCPDGKDECGNDFLQMYKIELWKALISKGKIVRMSEYVQGTKREIIESFSKCAIDILFAKQRLNEGIDIPVAKRAFFIASSTSEREFIQRRGRVLRKSPETNKKLAEIFDFIVVPPDTNSTYAESITQNEINRAMDFAKTADNYAEIEEKLRKYL